MSAEQFVQPYVPMILGITALFAPFLEVAVHDLTVGKITAIYNNMTNRAVGDVSSVTQLHIPVEKFPDVFEPYYETNWDGRKIKCVTVTVRDDKQKPVALICLNFDIAVFHDMQVNLKTFLEVGEHTTNPVELYGGDWQEKIDTQIEEYLSMHKLILGKLTREQKKNLVEELSKRGVFFLKNAAPYIAQKIGISRATVYNYLRVLRA